MLLAGGVFRLFPEGFLDESVEFLRTDDDGVFFKHSGPGVLQGVHGCSFSLPGVLQGVHGCSFSLAGVLHTDGVLLHGSSIAGALVTAGGFLQEFVVGVLHNFGVVLDDSLVGTLQLDDKGVLGAVLQLGVLQVEGVLLDVPRNGVLTGVFLAHPPIGDLLLLQTVALLVTFTVGVRLHSEGVPRQPLRSGSDVYPSHELDSSEESESDFLVKEKYDDSQLILKS